MNATAKKTIYKISDSSAQQVEDIIAVEKRLRISVNGKEVISLYCTPSMVRELVVGLLLTEGIIKGGWCAERMSIEYNNDHVSVSIQAEDSAAPEGEKVITSGCVGGITFVKKLITEKIEDDFIISADDLCNAFKEFQTRSDAYKITGCVHSAALYDGKSILVFAEDIGRHNAVDKVIGYSVIEDIPFKGKIMFASGRLSSEIASKCSRWAIPIIASRTAPTNLAVEIAELRGITLAGFVRGSRLNVYTHAHRIKNQ